MVHTLPPWTSKYRMIKIFGQIDSGELAARLGAASLYDRRGSLIWLDDFEAPVSKWAHSVSGTGSSIALSTSYSYLGSQSMRITTSTSVVSKQIIGKYFTLPPDTRIGVEYMCMPDDDKLLTEMVLNGFDGTNYYDPRIRVNFDTDVVQYYNSAGSWVEIESDLDFYDNLDTFLFIKLVFDWDTKKYVRLMVGREEYDLSAQSMKVIASALDPVLSVEIGGRSTEAVNHSLYIDNVILTQNEP